MTVETIEPGITEVVSEAKVREIFTLLRDYRVFHTPFGSAMPVDETGVKDASYGPAGYIESGQAFSESERELLAESYTHLDRALLKMKNKDQGKAVDIGFMLWLALFPPYLGDPGDPGLVEEWRKDPNNQQVTWIDKAVEWLADELADTDLFVVWPKRMSTRVSKKVDDANDEVWRLYRTMRGEGRSKSYCVRTAALLTGYSERRVWEIVKIREKQPPIEGDEY